MIPGILGQKLAQSRRFTEDGRWIPVTLIKAGPCVVVQLKKRENDGYQAVQLGFAGKKEKRIKRPILGHLKKAGLENSPPRFLKEVRLTNGESDVDKLKAGQKIFVSDVFNVGEKVRVSGISKGKGFAGVVKRHGFAGGPRTHGQSDRERAPGSIGQTTTPGRVYKGKRMAGRMGQDNISIDNLEVIEVNKQKNILVVKGLVPGVRNSLLVIQKR